jgi:hypothetical protein
LESKNSCRFVAVLGEYQLAEPGMASTVVVVDPMMDGIST